MFSIILQKNKSENNKIGKTLETVTTIQGTLKEGTSIVNPIIQIQHNGVINANYCSIDEFHRKYFITDIINIRNSLWEIHLKCDVLESFKSEIKSNSAIIDKQQNSNIDKYINDNSVVNEIKTFTETKEFTNGFNENPEYILVVAGGIPND